MEHRAHECHVAIGDQLGVLLLERSLKLLVCQTDILVHGNANRDLVVVWQFANEVVEREEDRPRHDDLGE
jgi:hypothetical protein